MPLSKNFKNTLFKALKNSLYKRLQCKMKKCADVENKLNKEKQKKCPKKSKKCLNNFYTSAEYIKLMSNLNKCTKKKCSTNKLRSLSG